MRLIKAVSQLSRVSFVSLAFFSQVAEYLAAIHPPELSRFVFTLRPAPVHMVTMFDRHAPLPEAERKEGRRAITLL